jgi:hypothetical protein
MRSVAPSAPVASIKTVHFAPPYHSASLPRPAARATPNSVPLPPIGSTEEASCSKRQHDNGPSQDGDDGLSADQEAPDPLPVHVIDPMTGRPISPLVAPALCVWPRRQMNARQIVSVDALKAASAEFTSMRHLAMRLRGLLRVDTVKKLDVWLRDARRSGIYGMQRFARALRHDIEYAIPCRNPGAMAKPKVRSTGSRR